MGVREIVRIFEAKLPDMKLKLLSINAIFICLIAIVFLSCTKTEDHLVGIWPDNILLSQKKIVFSSQGDSALVTARGSWWGINCISLDTIRITPQFSNSTNSDIKYLDSNLQLESRNDDTLYIKMFRNRTGLKRTLGIIVWNGDYHDAISVVQNSN